MGFDSAWHSIGGSLTLGLRNQIRGPVWIAVKDVAVLMVLVPPVKIHSVIFLATILLALL